MALLRVSYKLSHREYEFGDSHPSFNITSLKFIHLVTDISSSSVLWLTVDIASCLSIHLLRTLGLFAVGMIINKLVREPLHLCKHKFLWE